MVDAWGKYVYMRINIYQPNHFTTVDGWRSPVEVGSYFQGFCTSQVVFLRRISEASTVLEWKHLKTP